MPLEKKMNKMNKTIDLNKVGFFIIIITDCIYLVAGFLYNHFCADKIAMRDNHLISVSKMLTPPVNAIKIEEVLSHKLVGRNYKVTYDYEKDVEAIVHYRKIFSWIEYLFFPDNRNY